MRDPRPFWRDQHNHMYYSATHKRLLEFLRYSVDVELEKLFAEEIRCMDAAFWAE